jgi:serine/threonine protein kinase/WD40 repeat protein
MSGGEAHPRRRVARALAGLEAVTRGAALRALAAFERGGGPAPGLARALAAVLLRPSWGAWNGLLRDLRPARRAARRVAGDDEREHLEAAAPLHATLAALGARLDDELAAAARALAALAGPAPGLAPTCQQALELCLALHGRCVHAPPADEAWWASAAAALEVLDEAFEALRAAAAGPPGAASPWLVEHEGALLAFAGLDGESARYLADGAGGAAFAAPALAPDVLRAAQRLLGEGAAPPHDFRRWLGRLAPEDVPGVLLGGYLVGRPVAERGLVTVHVGLELATGRRVAVELLADGLPPDPRARFLEDAAALARLAQPNVVPAGAAGEAPWFPSRRAPGLAEEAWFRVGFAGGSATRVFRAREWVEGRTLETVFREVRPGALGQRAVAAWFAEAADGLATLHATGIVHGDLRPTDVVVDDDGRVRTAGPGVARTRAEERAFCAAAGRAPGALAYRAPEQLRGGGAPGDDAEVGPAADVYALCAIFLELLTGTRLPFDADDADARADAAAADGAARARKLAGVRPAALRTLRGWPLAWELRTLLRAGLDGDPARRPPSAADLAGDLRAFLEDRPIRLRRPSAARRARLAYRRHRLAARVGALALAVALGALGWYVWTAEGTTAEVAGRSARAALQRAVAQVRGGAAADQRATAEERQQQAEARRQRAEERRAAAEAAWRAAEAARARAVDEAEEAEAARAAAEQAARGAAARERATAARLALALEPPPAAGAVVAALEARAADPETAAPADAALRWFVSSYGRRVRSLEHGGAAVAVTALAFCPDDGCLVSGGSDGRLLLWDLPRGVATELLAAERPIGAVAFLDEQRLRVTLAAAAAGACEVRVVDRAAGAVTREDGPDPCAADAGASPDGRLRWRVEERPGAGGRPARRVVVRRTEGGDEVLSADAGDVLRAAWFSPDGRFVATATGGPDGSGAPAVIELRDTVAPAATQRMALPGSAALLAVATGAPTLLAADGGALRLYDGRTGREALRTLAGPEPLRSAALSGRGWYVAAGDAAGQVTLWEATTRPLVDGLAPLERGAAARLDAAGERLLERGPDGLRVSDLRSGRRRATLPQPDDVVGACRGPACASADGRWLAGLGADGKVRVWDLDGGRLRFEQEVGGRPAERAVGLVGEAEYLVVRGAGGAAVWRLGAPGDEPQAVTLRLPAPGAAAVPTPAGDFRVRVPWEGAQLWERVEGGRRTLLFEGALSPDGGRLARAAGGGRVEILAADGLTRLATVPAPEGDAALAFSPDGAILVVAGGGAVRAWRADGGEALAERPLPTPGAERLAVLPDGTVALPGPGALILWDAETGALRGRVALATPATPTQVWAGAGGRWLLAGFADDRPRAILAVPSAAILAEDVALRLPPAALERWRATEAAAAAAAAAGAGPAGPREPVGAQ